MQHREIPDSQEGQMQHGRVDGRRRRRTVAGVIGLAVSALALTACSSGGGGASAAGPSAGPVGDGGGSASTTTDAPSLASIAITPAGSGTIDVTTPIVVKASDGTLKSVTVTNPGRGTTVSGTTSADGTTWTSNEPLAYGTSYQVDAVGADHNGRTTEQKGTITTITPAQQANANMVPAPASVSSIGVAQPIVFQFVKPVANKALVQSHLKVVSSAGDTCAWYWISSSEVHCRGQNFWTPNSTLTVTASTYGLDFGNGVYGAEDRHEVYHVHDAMIAKADGNTETMTIWDNGQQIYSMPISMGKDATPTHTGTHVISSKAQSVDMNSCTYGVCPPDPKAYNETEYWAERMSNDGEFVHENPASVAAQGHTNVSHGCINLSEANAQWFFNHFGIGDAVEVTNSGGPPLPLNDTYGDWAVSWSTWSHGNA
jgi:lipoprotein-anchoring transpeptidase ErfK/SrfK